MAIEFLKEANLEGRLPSLIILDYNMPLMNGLQTYKEIRKYTEFSSIPVVLLTTANNRKEDDYWNKESVSTFIKPASFNELTKSVKKILRKTIAAEIIQVLRRK